MEPFTKLPSNYDKICSAARLMANAKGAVLLIYDGRNGSGLSVQCDARLLKHLPALMHAAADELQRENAKRPPTPGD
jgi:hypothetical protein